MPAFYDLIRYKFVVAGAEASRAGTVTRFNAAGNHGRADGGGTPPL
jgi:hypothetical protein